MTLCFFRVSYKLETGKRGCTQWLCSIPVGEPRTAIILCWPHQSPHVACVQVRGPPPDCRPLGPEDARVPLPTHALFLFVFFQGFVIKRVGSTQETVAFLLSLSLQVSTVVFPSRTVRTRFIIASLQASDRASEHLVPPLAPAPSYPSYIRPILQKRQEHPNACALFARSSLKEVLHRGRDAIVSAI